MRGLPRRRIESSASKVHGGLIALENADAGTNQLLEALDVLPIGVVISSSDGKEVMRNQRAKNLSGDPRIDVLVNSAIKDVLLDALAGTYESRTLEFHGSPLRVFTVDPQVRPGGTPIVLIDDISERRQLDAIRRDFVANVSHELRTPVGALGLLTEMLVDETDPEVIARLNSRIVGEVDRAKRLIEQLLDLSRIEASGQVSRQPIAIKDVVDGAIERAGGVAAQHRMRLDVQEKDRACKVLGDSEEITSAILNLIENAAKYSEKDSQIQIEINTDDHWVSISVTDFGIGIPHKDLNRIFERFFRIDPARSRETGGAGLGLAIVRHVAHNHGGEVSVMSREGEGSTFTFTLPIAS